MARASWRQGGEYGAAPHGEGYYIKKIQFGLHKDEPSPPDQDVGASLVAKNGGSIESDAENGQQGRSQVQLWQRCPSLNTLPPRELLGSALKASLLDLSTCVSAAMSSSVSDPGAVSAFQRVPDCEGVFQMGMKFGVVGYLNFRCGGNLSQNHPFQ